jgi:hypothetical protein
MWIDEPREESDKPMPSAGWYRVQELACSKAGGLVLILSGLAIAAHGALSDFGSSWSSSAVRTDAPCFDTSTQGSEHRLGAL